MHIDNHSKQAHSISKMNSSHTSDGQLFDEWMTSRPAGDLFTSFDAALKLIDRCNFHSCYSAIETLCFQNSLHQSAHSTYKHDRVAKNVWPLFYNASFNLNIIKPLVLGLPISDIYVYYSVHGWPSHIH